MCDGRGEWIFSTCPVCQLESEVGGWPHAYLREFARYRRGILPMSGGFHDHPAPFVQAMDILDSVHAGIEREEYKQRERELEQARARK